MSKFNSGQNIGEIVVQFPKAAEIFKANKIDFCCGGNRPLAEALKEQGLDEKIVMDKRKREENKSGLSAKTQKAMKEIISFDKMLDAEERK